MTDFSESMEEDVGDNVQDTIVNNGPEKVTVHFEKTVNFQTERNLLFYQQYQNRRNLENIKSMQKRLHAQNS